MALPRHLLILAWPSVPTSVGTSPIMHVGDREDLAVEGVEAAGDLARDLDVRLVVLAHRHQVGARQQDVGGLQHRVAQQAEGQRLSSGCAAWAMSLMLGRRCQARHGHQHLEEQVQLVDLVHGRLQEDGALRAGRCPRRGSRAPCRGRSRAVARCAPSPAWWSACAGRR